MIGIVVPIKPLTRFKVYVLLKTFYRKFRYHYLSEFIKTDSVLIVTVPIN